MNIFAFILTVLFLSPNKHVRKSRRALITIYHQNLCSSCQECLPKANSWLFVPAPAVYAPSEVIILHDITTFFTTTECDLWYTSKEVGELGIQKRTNAITALEIINIY